MHVDIHGKMDRANNMDLDVGMGPMEEEWDEKGTELIKSVVGNAIETALEGRYRVSRKSKKRMPCTVETEPLLSGYWGHHSSAPLTISHQAVLLGVPALQLEIPYSMREMLANDDSAFNALSNELNAAIDVVLSSDLGEGCFALAQHAPLEPSGSPSGTPSGHEGGAEGRGGADGDDGDDGDDGADGYSLADLSVLSNVDDTWMQAMLYDLARMDTESVHGKQI